MNGKPETLAALDRANIAYELVEHEPITTMEAMRSLGLPFEDDIAKNLFVRDDKKRAYFLISLSGTRQISLKELRAALGSRPLSFASQADLAAKLGLAPGAVTPLGALNDDARTVEVVLDSAFVTSGRIAVHPCDNTATLRLATADLVKLLRDRGTPVRVLTFEGTDAPAEEPAQTGR